MTTEQAQDAVDPNAAAPAEGFGVEADPNVEVKTEAEGEGVKAEEGEKKEAAPQGAPESYADFNLPEEFALDSELLAEFVPTLKELNLSQEAAQKVIDFAPKLVSKAVEGITAQLVAEAKSWHVASRSDKEIGGADMAQKLAVANKAVDTFGTPELKAFLASKGLSAHPELIRAFYRAGLTIREDTIVPGGRTTVPAKAFYDRSKMN